MDSSFLIGTGTISETLRPLYAGTPGATSNPARHDRLTRDDAVPHSHGRKGAGREVEVHARAESDDSDAFARAKFAAGDDAADDPAREQTRDEDESHGGARRRRDDDRGALVLFRRLGLHRRA